MERILVAGATGNNGRALVENLQTRDGVLVRALVRSPNAKNAHFGPGVEVVQGDLADPSSLDLAFRDVDRAFAVMAIVPDADQLFDTFFAAAKRSGTRHLVKLSGLGASDDSPSELIRQHAASDRALREVGVPYTIVRPNSFYQNMLWQAQGIASEGRFYLPMKEARQSTIDLRDLAEIIANILTEDTHLGATYDLTGPEPLSFFEVASIIEDMRRVPTEYVPIMPAEAEAAMIAQGMPEWSAKVLTEIQDLFATGKYAEVLPDAEALLGRVPTTFRTFAQDHAAAWQPTSLA